MSNLPKEPGFTPYGIVFPPLTFTVSSQTIAKGDPVVITSGLAVVGTSAAAKTDILGIAAETITSSATSISVWCNPAQLYLANCSGLAATCTQARFGVLCDIEGSTGAFYINEDSGSYDCIVPLGLAPGETIGLDYMRIICRLNYIYA